MAEINDVALTVMIEDDLRFGGTKVVEVRCPNGHKIAMLEKADLLTNHGGTRLVLTILNPLIRFIEKPGETP